MTDQPNAVFMYHRDADGKFSRGEFAVPVAEHERLKEEYGVTMAEQMEKLMLSRIKDKEAEHERIVEEWMKHSNESYLKGEQNALRRVKEAIENKIAEFRLFAKKLDNVYDDAGRHAVEECIDSLMQMKMELGLDEKVKEE